MNSALKRFYLFTGNNRRLQQYFLVFGLINILLGVSLPSVGQDKVLDVGIRVQKAVNLYYENGITLQYSENALASERLYFGFSYLSSRLGSAIGSNALQQDNFLFSTSFFFRPAHLIRPLLRVNIGYFISDLEEPMFEDLPSNSLLLSSEAGICLDPESPFKLTASLGYNFITGDGTEGPGTLYPVFLQTSLSWDIFQTRRNK